MKWHKRTLAPVRGVVWIKKRGETGYNTDDYRGGDDMIAHL